MIEIHAAGTVQVLTFSSGRVNALDVELLEELTDAVRELQRSDAGALVVTGAGRAFSAGVDLNRVVEGGADYTDRLIPAISEMFVAMFCYPGPTVAAINGAAIAGGCVLACACDRRLISPDAQIGASEVRVGVPFPVAALEVMRYACGDHAEEVLLGGRIYRGAEAVASGLAHRVVAEDLVEAAVAEASDLGDIPVDAYRHTKAQLRGPTLARIREAGGIDHEVRQLWGAERRSSASPPTSRACGAATDDLLLVIHRARRRPGCACAASDVTLARRAAVLQSALGLFGDFGLFGALRRHFFGRSVRVPAQARVRRWPRRALLPLQPLWLFGLFRLAASASTLSASASVSSRPRLGFFGFFGFLVGLFSLPPRRPSCGARRRCLGFFGLIGFGGGGGNSATNDK